MAEYNFKEIEPKWQKHWTEKEVFKSELNTNKPKFYSLDMFPYPSGAGLHVGHPLGYIASDIVSRFKRLKGFNVLHPMGFDAFGLPAEQYAIITGQHPAITTKENITRYKQQLKNIGFSFDWDKEVQTCDPKYYKWTQWITLQLFNSWYDKTANKARPIDELESILSQKGNIDLYAACDDDISSITKDQWNNFNNKEKSDLLLKYRLAYLANTSVNWCPALGTVLSNDEVKDGFSERGSHPVEKKVMSQWNMRITAYADRLLNGLDKIDWPEPLKDMQRNWIGRSTGAEFSFEVADSNEKIKVFTTRIDTIFGVTYVAIAPESDLVDKLTTADQKNVVNSYVSVAKNRSERDRMSDVKTISGVFTGSYVINPFDGAKIPVWVADYVLAGYGTGAVMAVPCGDQRDYDFAKHFDLPIIPVIKDADISEKADATKDGIMINSGFLNGMTCLEAIDAANKKLEELGIGSWKIQYRMRDAIYARQRYWGEPFPVYFKDGIPTPLSVSELPLELPEINAYKPTENGEPPLGRAIDWKHEGKYEYELSTMPGWAGSSWYYFRYMDSHNEDEFVSKEAQEYWQDVDLYIGGSEHATGHLLYSRFWAKFLYDLGHVNIDEPFKKLVNQGMIQGRSNFVYAVRSNNQDLGKKLPEIFVSKSIRDESKSGELTTTTKNHVINTINKSLDNGLQVTVDDIDWSNISDIHVDVNIVRNDILDVDAFKSWRPDLNNAIVITDPSDGQFHCGHEVEKMSKSKHNVVSPDDVIDNYGADTLRLYEMFLGPLEQFKPWNTNGIDGVYKFLRKLWNLYHDKSGQFNVSDNDASKEELKALHKTIKKATEDVDNLSFNTSVSTFMICVNELTALKCNSKTVLESLAIIISPYAPHITEELWQKLGYSDSINFASYPVFDSKHLKEDSHEYPIMVNGKMRAKIKFGLDLPKEDIEMQVLTNESVKKWLDGKQPKKVIIVPKKIVNVVV